MSSLSLSSSPSPSPVVTMNAYPVRSLDADSDSDSDTGSSKYTRKTSSKSSNMEMNLVRQSFPAGIISDDVDVDVDVDADADLVAVDAEKGQESSVSAQEQHSVASEEAWLEDLPTTEEEDEKASFRRTMMMQQKSSPSGMSIRIADLSHDLRRSVKDLQLDLDDDGQLDTDEILAAVNHLTSQTKKNSSLNKIVCALWAFMIFLVACVFASSITAARLVNDIKVDPINGIMYAKGGDHSIIKTGDVAIYSSAPTVAKMTNDELDVLKAILPGNGGVKFQVKGYARKGDGSDEVRVLVEGGTITYDSKGIKDATGNAKVLLAFAYGFTYNDVVDYSTHYRYGPNDGYESGGK